ncbi:helix-turn-helix domain-containing protein [Dactylosporangium sp. NPDC049525]|uniref:IclR family transcriptional regulator n=1 Tax=Dactylosporangium sp. NPDC049525 TaxID=3154730 RepID=UPI0034214607
MILGGSHGKVPFVADTPMTPISEVSALSADAIGRAVRLLERLASSGHPVALSNLARDTELPKSTAYRILQTLSTHGMVARRGNRYVLGPRMHALTSMVMSGPRGVRKRLMPYLLDLHRHTGGIARLALLRGEEVVYVETLHGHAHAALIPGVPDRVPAGATPSGRLLLAFAAGTAPRQRRSEADAGQGAVLPSASERRAILHDGFAHAERSPIPGLDSVAMPILGSDSLPVAAFELATTTPVLRSQSAMAALREAALAGSVALRTLPPEGHP